MRISKESIVATINTTDDLIRLLREDEEFREAARKELLPQELLDLPAAHAAFVKEVREFVRATELRFEEINRRFDAMDQRFDAMDQRSDAMGRRLDSLDEKTDRIEANVGRISHDLRTFRGNYAERAAAKDAIGIAMSVSEANGLEADLDINGTTVKVLSADEIRALARAYGSQNLTSIPRGDRISFYQSDVIIEVSNEDDETYYIAVEVSYTCNGRDTRRAMTHADLLTKFTGKQAWAVITGVRVDRRIQSLIDEGKVFWYPTNDSDLVPLEDA